MTEATSPATTPAMIPATTPVSAHPAAWRLASWGIFLVTAVSFVAALALWAGVGFVVPPVAFYRSSWIVVLEFVLIVAPSSMGLLLGLHLPGNRVALLLAAVGVVLALQNLADMLIATPTFAAGPLAPPVAWAASTLTFPLAVLLGILLVLTFPDGRHVSPVWSRAAWLGVIGCVLLVPYQGLAPGYLSWYVEFPNPVAVPAGSETWLVMSRFVALTAIGLSLVLAAWSMVTRYRDADQVLRLQLKWFVYGAALLVITALAQIVAFVTLPHDSALGELTLAALFIAAGLMPVTAAVAISRFGLYGIDVLIDRTFVFGALTAVLAGLYAAAIRLFNALFVGVTGQESDGALVLTTLVLATTFTPIKGRLEKVVARRYERAGTPALPAAPLDEAALRALVTDVVREELARRVRD